MDETCPSIIRNAYLSLFSTHLSCKPHKGYKTALNHIVKDFFLFPLFM